MELTKHQTPQGARWAYNGHWLPQSFGLTTLLELPHDVMREVLQRIVTAEAADGALLAPLDPLHEVWASGVTYLRSRDARKAESTVADVYEKVYDAERPELFFKAAGWRVVGHMQPVRVRRDSQWNVPEPELVLVINRYGTIVGYCAGNDMSSRSIEGDNPLYLPQAKIYNGACALGPQIVLAQADDLRNLPVQLRIQRAEQTVFAAETNARQMKRRFEELVAYLGQELDFPHGVFLMTGTGIVPGEAFSLQPGDTVNMAVGACRLSNQVAA